MHSAVVHAVWGGWELSDQEGALSTSDSDLATPAPLTLLLECLARTLLSRLLLLRTRLLGEAPRRAAATTSTIPALLLEPFLCLRILQPGALACPLGGRVKALSGS